MKKDKPSLFKDTPEGEYSKVYPRAGLGFAKGYGLGKLTSFGYNMIAPSVIESLMAKGKLKGVSKDAIKVLKRSPIRPSHIGLLTAIPFAKKEIDHNIDILNKQKEELENLKKASTIIDELYKTAKEEKLYQKKMDCENCGYEGHPTVRGECASCGSVGGLKVKDREFEEHTENIDPNESINLYEADLKGRFNE